MEYQLEQFDVAVIGGGHAGIEAALAAARLGVKTALFTLTLDQIANMPCNPSIGGTAKGHLVREIDALGGEMGKAADATMLQSRMLNRGKGPAVHSLRMQADRRRYHDYMKGVLERQENLWVIQAEIVEIRVGKENEVTAVVSKLGGVYPVKAAIVACGTYLHATVHVGECSYQSGPDGTRAAEGLSGSLKRLGIELRRFKTGTPARVNRRSIDFSKLAVQKGDEPVCPFSFETTRPLVNSVDCHIAYTNAETHRVILENLDRSPLFSGRIEGVGPRYCPSIEDKVVRFKDKERHQLFIEPMGQNTEEYYLQGMSSSLPEDVQLRFLRTIEGLERVEIMRSAYAIEYDCCNPLALAPSLEFREQKGLFGAGQFNGTSGYEEAAAQGLVAGVNAARKVKGLAPLILGRQTSYIGTLIDDLVTKGCEEPYRMMTSRSEYRLLLRQDNADLRLTPIGYEIGLITKERYEALVRKQEAIKREIDRLKALSLSPSPALNAMLKARKTIPLVTGIRAGELLKRPQVSYESLSPFDPGRPALPPAVTEQAEIEIKYEGYIRRQLEQVRAMEALENRLLPQDIDYQAVSGLRLEAREKLGKIRPLSVGQASRISGVSPADVTVLLIHLGQRNAKKTSAAPARRGEKKEKEKQSGKDGQGHD